MDALLLARFQFAFTIGFHWLFPSLTVGFSWINVWFMTKYIRSGDDPEKKLQAEKSVRFWLKLFTITFAVGVATGLTMALQFGTNWANYSTTVGDVIGPALAAEVLLSFFLESTFLGVLLFGWNKVSPKVLWLSAFLVALGTFISAFWILVVDSWMQTPVGFVTDANGNVILDNFTAAVLNPSTIIRVLHTVTASFVVAAFFILGISSYYHLRNKNEYLVRFSFKTAMTVLLVGSILLLIFGHIAAAIVADTQPAKFAVYELIQNTTSHESFPALAIIDPFDGSVLFVLYVPFFTLGDIMMQGTNHVYKGMSDPSFAGLLPPISVTVYSFHIMILLGLYFIAFALVGVILTYKGRIFENKSYNKLYLFIAIISIPLPFIASELGWAAAEIGRQPWVVYGLLKTQNAISVNVPELQLFLSLVGFLVIYSLLFLFWILLLLKTIRLGPDAIESAAYDTQPVEPSKTDSIKSGEKPVKPDKSVGAD